jgi:PAS domain S-box-containing protein
MDALFLNEQRCACGKLLLKGIFFDGALEIKCKSCGAVNKIGSIKLADDETHYLLIINNKGIITNVSNSACNTLGYTCEELIGLNFIKINPLMSHEISKIFLDPKSILNHDNYFQFDTYHRQKNGKDIPVTIMLKLYQPSGKERYVLLSAEVKNNLHYEKILKNEEIIFLDSSCDFYFDIDKEATVEYVSPSVDKFLGIDQSYIVGKNYFDFVPESRKEQSKKAFEYFSSVGKSYRIKGNIESGLENNIIYDELCFTPRHNDNGKFVGYRVLVWIKNNLIMEPYLG